MHTNDPPELVAKLAFLGQPASWPSAPPAVDVRATHLAYVFLVGDEAFKLKRPVRYHDVDYTGLDARETACRREVELNRRFARDVYRGVVALHETPKGLGFDPAGPIVDWLVRMRRLPTERMLDRLLADAAASESDARRVATYLADCYGRLAPAERDEAAQLARLRRVLGGDLAVLRGHCDGVPQGVVGRIEAAQRRFLAEHADLVAARVHAGRIVEGHADLRPEHICLEAEPVVIDCLEWDGDLRVVDGLADIVFLALECERSGAAAIGRTILATYQQRAGDHVDPRLLAFYRRLQSCARAKLAVWHLADPGPSGPGKWMQRAREYLEIAECEFP